MASANKNNKQSNSFDNTEHIQASKHRHTPILTRRRSVNDTQLRTVSQDNKHKMGYITEPEHNHQSIGVLNEEILSEDEENESILAIKEEGTNNVTQTYKALPNNLKSFTDNMFVLSATTKPTQTETELVNFLGIGHDPHLQTHSERSAIERNAKFEVQTNTGGLTLERLKKTLERQPKTVHLTFHGEYDCETQKSMVKIDRIPTLPALLKIESISAIISALLRGFLRRKCYISCLKNAILRRECQRICTRA